MNVGVGQRRIRRASYAAVSAILLFGIRPAVARAEQAEITIAKEFGIGYLPYMIMEHDKLIEKHAKQRGLGDLLGGSRIAHDRVRQSEHSALEAAHEGRRRRRVGLPVQGQKLLVGEGFTHDDHFSDPSCIVTARS